MAKHRIATLHELEDRRMLQVTAGDREILLIRLEGEVRALGARCPHQHAPLVDGLLHGHRLVCPWHQAAFDARTGDLLEPPALDCLPVYPVEVRGGEVLVELPAEPRASRQPEIAAPDASADGRTVVIVGAGSAGLAAAQEVRRAGFRGRVVMIGDEEHPPYDRTHCSKDYLSGDAPAEWMPLKPAGFYADAGIERVTARVSAVDLRERVVTLPGGATIRADGLLLATGGVPRRLDLPGSDLDGVLTLRSWADADEVARRADRGERAVVVGASFIAMEAASSLRARGLASVTVVAPEKVPFERTLGARVGGWLRALHESHGVSFRLGRQVERFSGNGSVSGVVLDDGSRVDADLVLLGVGVRPATDLVRGVELREDGSLLTDELMRVCDGVYAAGDIATFPDWRTGEPTRIEHWRTAAQQGTVAGRNLAGEARTFRAAPFFWTMHHGTPLGYLGHAPSWDEEIEHGDVDSADFAVYYLRDGTVLAAAAAGSRGARLNALHELMLLGRTPAASELREGDLELRSLIGSSG